MLVPLVVGVEGDRLPVTASVEDTLPGGDSSKIPLTKTGFLDGGETIPLLTPAPAPPNPPISPRSLPIPAPAPAMLVAEVESPAVRVLPAAVDRAWRRAGSRFFQ